MSYSKGRLLKSIRDKMARGEFSQLDQECLLSLVDHYRARIHEVASEASVREGRLWKELGDFKLAHMLAREIIDPEQERTGYSQVDLAQASLSEQAAERVRKRVLAHRARSGSLARGRVCSKCFGVGVEDVDAPG